MTPFKLTACAFLGLMLATPAYAASEAECKAMFEKADMNKDGMLAQDEAVSFEKAMTGAGPSPRMRR